jgi:lysophospholipase L1-like esterase
VCSTNGTTLRRIYVFDLAAIASGLAVAAGQLALRVGSRSPWRTRELFALSLYAAGIVALTVRRQAAYTQAVPWLVSFFAASATVALAVTFWPQDTLLFVLATGAGSLMLSVAGALRRKAASDPVMPWDLAKVAIVAGGMLLTLAATEVVFRLAPGILGEELHDFLHGDSREYIVAHPYIGHLYESDSTMTLSHRDFDVVQHVDAFGFRNAWPWPRQADVVVLGDSVVTGYGVADDQAWPAVLARSIPRSQVINLGQGGAAPQQYLRIYQTFGVRLQPRLLVVGVHVDDDYWDAGMFDRWIKSGIGGNYVIWRDFAGRPEASSLWAHVKVYAYGVALHSHLYQLIDAVRSRGRGAEIPTTIRLADGSGIQLLPRDFAVKSAAADPERREFQLTVEALRELHALATENGAHMLIVLEPGKEEVYLPLLNQTSVDPTRALRAVLEKLGIEYLDLAPAFRQRAAGGEPLFFSVDRHPNVAGYAFIGQLVRDHIQQNSTLYGLDELRRAGDSP